MERTPRYLITAIALACICICNASIAADITEQSQSEQNTKPTIQTADDQVVDVSQTTASQDTVTASSEEMAVAELSPESISEPSQDQTPTATDKQTDDQEKPVPATISKTAQTEKVAKTPKVVTAPVTPSLFDVIELEDHANNKNYQQGYELAQKILPHWEGDSTFDFLYGVHAIETGHYDEATFAFERLTLLNPKTLRYRLELARALYFNNNLDTAKTEFEIALAGNPPENVKTNIKGFLKRIQKSKEKATHNWAAGAGVNFGFDSNINSGTEEDGVEIPNIGFVSLQEEAQSLSSAFSQFNTQGIYSYSHKKHHSLDVSFNTTHKRNDEVSTYDLDVINLFGGYSWQPSRSIRLQGGLTNTNVKLDGEAYQNQSAISAMALYTRKNGFSFSANINAGSRSAESETAPDADISLYSLSMIWPSSNVKSTNLSLYSGSDDVSKTTLAHFGKETLGLHFGTKLLITQSVVRSMLISINTTEYQAADPNFQEVRKDTAIMGSWGYAWNASKYISVSSNLMVSHNASNLDLFTSYRAIFNTGLSVNF